MMLEGTVTNVAAFGAFVDIGVHQDGLVHVSQLADRFVKDPRDVVKAGQIVKVRVIDVDVKRNRIALSMRKDSAGNTGAAAGTGRGGERDGAANRGGDARRGKDDRRGRGIAPDQKPKGALGAALAAALDRK
jgi:uncharacterized protein